MTVNEFAKTIRDNLDGLNPMRSRRIAVTESAKVENYGELEGYRQTEFVEFKGWLCAKIETSRAGHVKADDDYSGNPIPLDDMFQVKLDMGGKNERTEDMEFPGDGTHGASAGNVINCLCTMFPQVQEV